MRPVSPASRQKGADRPIRTMKSHLATTLLLATFALPPLGSAISQEDSPWHSRYAPAVEQARKEEKSLFIVFAASSWVELSETFQIDILDQPEFLEPVVEQAVLLRLEFPRSNRLPEDRAREYQLLKNAYRVRGYPTVVLTDAEGRPFGLNGYQPISAAEYARITLEMIEGRRMRDAAAKKAEGLKGLDRARALVDAIPDLPGNLAARYYREEMDEVISLDSRNRTGKVQVYRGMIADVEYANEMQRLAADVRYGDMVNLTDRYIRDQKLTGSQRQKALMNKADIQRKQQNTIGMVETLLDVVSEDPESTFGKQAQEVLDRLRAQKIQESLAR